MSKHLSDPTVDCSTLVELLRWRALHQPDRRAYTFLVDGETEEVSLTYEGLDRRARAIGAWLHRLGANGERALLLHPPGLEYVAAFFGCLYAGVVAVPVYPPRPNRPMTRLQAIGVDAEAKLALTTVPVLSNVERRLAGAPELKSLQWLATDDVAGELAAEWREPAVNSDTLALLQYTSGSTAVPKGVMVTHGNLTHNLAQIYRRFELTSHSRAVSWLPPYHDMGLIGGTLQPLYGGFPVTLMSPVAFLQRPLRWLQAISRTRATVSGGPNFAYDLCVRKITSEQRATLDLTSWEVASNGAEPIRLDTLERFAATFEPCGFRREAFYPCYGLAEATLFATGGLKGAPPVVRTVQPVALEQNRIATDSVKDEGARILVSCGQTLPDQKIVIVHPESLSRCAPDQVGEIWVSGPSVARGYWNRPEETEHTFAAYLSDTGEGPFLRTGDLGFLQDGELFVTGRLKDLIIIGGRNHYPQDIELTVEESHPALRPGCGAAFAVDAAGEERLVIVQEVDHRLRSDADEVIEAIRQAVTENHEVPAYAVLLIKPGGIPKTSSGKIQRHACRAAFLSRSLDVVGEWVQAPEDGESQVSSSRSSFDEGTGSLEKSQTAEAIQAWLVSQISRRLKVHPNDVDVREPFVRYGLDSVTAVSLSGDLEAQLRRRLSPTLVYEYPTIEALARHLAAEPVSGSTSTADEDRGTETEPIAIIGLGCRFPGAKNPESFWQLLRDGVDAITEVPAERWDLRAFYDPDPALPGKTNARWGGFLEQVDQFDPHFFGVSPREAARMDPQQRLLLEVAWEALEDAGQVRERLAGTRTGVFIGISTNDYGQIQFSDPRLIDAYAGTGNALSIAANRISYVFDFRGPSMAVDTACSSSLVAVHLACQSLWNRESTLALAGGVNVILSPAGAINFTKAGAMAVDGRCKAFDARANGFVRSEGAGAVVLKPLSRALTDGDPIYAVIRGSAVNQDGRTNGLMAPSRQAQEAVMLEACRRARVSPGQVRYVEAHGTGTFLGDPIEAKALGTVLAIDRSPGDRCALGSVKTNIGHLESAAGIAGLIKVALMLKHRAIPPSLHFLKPNPLIPFDQLPLRVQETLGPWPEGSGPALAGVSSLGFGGTNSHVVLEEAPRTLVDLEPGEETASGHAHLLTLSAHSPEALRCLARDYRDFLFAEGAGAVVGFEDICYTASVRRSHHDHRLALVFHSRAELTGRLEAFLQGELRPNMSSGRKVAARRRKLVFVFSGQGSHWFGMGRELLQQEPVFRAALEQCDQALRQELDWSLLEELTTDEAHSRLDRVEIIQSSVFAIQVALAALWRSWSIEPDAVVGHSMGEVAAAHVAGALGLGDALRVIARRGRLLKSVAGRGAMAAVGLSLEQARRALADYKDLLSIAVINSPTSTVLSGDRPALEEIVEKLQGQDIFCRLVNVDVAYHSPQLDPLGADLLQALEGVQPRLASVPIFSTVTGRVCKGPEFDANYWARNLREPVLFSTAVQRLLESGHNIFLELSPHPILSYAIREGLRHFGQEGAALASLRRQEPERAVMLGALGALYTLGHPIDWRRVYPAGGRCVRLPSYPWQRERCWLEERAIPGSFSAAEAVGQQVGVARAPSSVERLEGHVPAGVLKQHLDHDAQDVCSENLDSWLYELQWQPKARSERQQGSESPLPGRRGTWLIFGDRGGVGRDLAALLREGQRERCVLVSPGEKYECLDEERFRIRPGQLEDMRQLFERALGSDQPACRGVVHLWSLDALPPEETTIASLETAQTLGCGSVLSVVQELARAGWSEPPRLWLVTRGAQPVGEEPFPQAVAQAPLWGLGRTIALEHSPHWGGLVDLDLAGDAADASRQLFEEISSRDGEDQLAFRQGERYVARLVPKRHSAGEEVPLQFQPDGTYLITGGLGELGLAVARWMVERGVRRLILLARTKFPARSSWDQVEKGSRLALQISTIRELEAQGASVYLGSVDVGDEPQLTSFLEEFRREAWPPIRGVVHAAGVVAVQPLLELDTAALNAVLRPKVLGGWLLHRLLEEASLDMFVLFSSAATLLSSPLLGSYAAASAFLDALAHHRRAQGRPALSINWGFWAEAGMAARHQRETGREFAPQGMGTFTPEQGLNVLGRLLRQGSTQVGVMPVDWRRWSHFHPAASKLPLLARLMGEEGGLPPSAGGPRGKASLTRETLLRLQPGEGQRLLETYLREQLARVLGLPLSMLDADQPLNNLGIDSLMAVELKNQLETDLGVSVPMVQFLQGPSVAQLAALLLDQLTGGGSATSARLPKLDQLSDKKAASFSMEESITKLISRVSTLANEKGND